MPPRMLVGRDVPVMVGLRVVLAEAYQRIPRLAQGTIIKVRTNIAVFITDITCAPPDS